MPNHVINELRISGPHGEIKKMLDSMDTGRREFDFSVIRSAPVELMQLRNKPVAQGLEHYLRCVNPATPSIAMPGEPKMSQDDYDRFFESFKGYTQMVLRRHIINDDDPSRRPIDPSLFKTGKDAAECVRKYGYASENDWNRAEWGSDTNAYDIRILFDEADASCDDAAVRFCTAWTPVINIAAAVAAKYPQLKIEYLYAEDQCGRSAGRISFESGVEASREEYKDYEREAYEIYFGIWRLSPAECMMVYDPRLRNYAYCEAGDGLMLGGVPLSVSCAVISNPARDGPAVFTRRLDETSAEKERSLKKWLMHISLTTAWP